MLLLTIMLKFIDGFFLTYECIEKCRTQYFKSKTIIFNKEREKKKKKKKKRKRDKEIKMINFAV
jgi:hypothetical protein